MTKADVAMLAEPPVYPGLAAAINSLVHHGFDGNVWVGYRGTAPAWARAPVETNDPMLVGSCRVHMIQLATKRPFTYHKAAFVRQVLEELSPECEAVVYMDTDIVINRGWPYFAAWLTHGIALVEDLPAHRVGRDHPERLAWVEWIESLDLTVARTFDRRFNAGFVGLPRSLGAFLDPWSMLADAAEAATSMRRRTSHYISETASRPEPVVIPENVEALLKGHFHEDQDALNMALMVSSEPISSYGPDGMGFTSSWNVPMVHALGEAKPWNKKFLRHRVRTGAGPSIADIIWWRYAAGPLPVLSPRERKRASLALTAARIADRVF